MATRKATYDDDQFATADNSERPPIRERETSISAHIVRSIAVTMSGAEMDILCGMLTRFGLRDEDISPTESIILREFIVAVESAR